MSTPTLLVQITDLHIKRPGALAYGKVDTAAYLRRAIVALNRFRPRPDAVVITGDLVDAGDVEEYAHLKTYLDELQLPYYLLVGNHDARAPLRSIFGDAAYLQQGDYIQYTTDVGPLRLIALDSLDSGASGGTLCESRLAWLAQRLEESTDRPVVVALHHPPFATGIGHMDGAVLAADATARLAEIVQKHPNVERVIAGHMHREIHKRFAGTLASTAASPAHQVCLDLRDDAPSEFNFEPPSFVVHRWSAGDGLVSHLAFVDDYAGPYPFRDDSGELLP